MGLLSYGLLSLFLSLSLPLSVALTSSVSHPPTMLRPRPKCPLQISMVLSTPGIMGQLRRSGVRAEPVGQSDRPLEEEAFLAVPTEEWGGMGGWEEETWMEGWRKEEREMEGWMEEDEESPPMGP